MDKMLSFKRGQADLATMLFKAGGSSDVEKNDLEQCSQSTFNSQFSFQRLHTYFSSTPFNKCISNQVVAYQKF